MKAGCCSFRKRLTIKGPKANITNGFLRGLICVYMPYEAKVKDLKNILTDRRIAKLNIGDFINIEMQNLIIYSTLKAIY